MIGLYAVLLLVILTGNGLILSAFFINKRLRTATNTLIMGLAVSDILVGFVSIPCWLAIFTSYYEYASTTQTTYRFYITFDIFIGGASILQLTALSVERCHAIVCPLRHRTLSIKVFYVMIAIPWLYAAIVASLQPVQFAGDWQNVYTLLVAFTCFFIPFIVIFFAYLFIYRFARNQPGKKSICQHRAVRQAYKKRPKTICHACVHYRTLRCSLAASFCRYHDWHILPTLPSALTTHFPRDSAR